MKTISSIEKNDILLALALVYEKNYSETGGESVSKNALELAEKSFNALNSDDFVEITSSASFFDELSVENQEIWREKRIAKIRGRGKTTTLDENINPTHLADNLRDESKPIQNLILQNLPKDLSRRIAHYLKLGVEKDTAQANQNIAETQINPVIFEVVKQRFWANFVMLEDIYEPNVLDKFSVAELENFIRQLGLREVALACRGISSKETLAAFLNRFDADDVREIATYITELEKVRPFWVAQADEIVRQTWNKNLPPKKVLKIIGLKLLALAYTKRELNAQNHAKQKLSIQDSKPWLKFIAQNQEALQSEAVEPSVIIERRRKSVERLANKFVQTGRL